MIYRMVEPIKAQPGYAPSSLNEKTRTVELVFATETPVSVYDSSTWDTINEKLLMSGADLSALPGAPVLDSHRQTTVAAILGVVERAWTQGSEARALIRFGASPEAESALQAVMVGVLRNVSVGFEILQSGPAKKQTPGEPPLIEISRWRAREISLCPLGADPMAQIRSLRLTNRASAVLPRPDSEARIAAAQRKILKNFIGTHQ